jgi:isopenicillin-N epimerase
MSLPSAQDAKELFDLAKGFTNFNHGSFGAVAKKVKARQNELHLLAEARPDRWFRETIYTLSKESRTRVASMIEASVDDVVLVENASTAINAILRGRLQKGDKVLRFSNTYNMCIETFKWLGVEQVVVDINFPVVDDKTLIDRLVPHHHRACGGLYCNCEVRKQGLYRAHRRRTCTRTAQFKYGGALRPRR